MDLTLERVWELKQALVDFVLDAEGDLATALETYSADRSRNQQSNIIQREQMIDAFLTEGQIGDRTPIDFFLEENASLSEADRQLVQDWQRSFIGLFGVEAVQADGLKLMNWLTAKVYFAQPGSQQMMTEMQRLQVGEILLTRIAPLPDDTWMISGPYLQMGKLGKPKLAVAIGNFKDNYRYALYSDAPELLEEAWRSVEQYHHDFLDFFGSDEVTMSGYQFGKKLEAFQTHITDRQLAKAGIDPSKSLAEIAEEAGVSEEEIAEAAETLGVDAKAATAMLKNRESARMVTPKIELPPDLKKAEQLTILAHPRWGQVFLPHHSRFLALLEGKEETAKDGERLVQHYLKERSILPFVWYSLAERYPTQLEALLQNTLNRPEFKLEKDLDILLKEFGKPLEPELPESASVPIHLHNLFQKALAEVSKSKGKEKAKSSSGKGFGR
ncbi:MAG: hypothetical protein SFW36_18220 [Leptolyngbyaceae cyanobacterium bins.59]|nr:hypothetical protein [Leptolyngbyaceae cyanobacterium bins.59]